MPAEPSWEDPTLDELMYGPRDESSLLRTYVGQVPYERPAGAPPERRQPTYVRSNPLAGVEPPRRPRPAAARRVVPENVDDPANWHDFEEIVNSARRTGTPASVFNPEQVRGLGATTSQVSSGIDLLRDSLNNVSNVRPPNKTAVLLGDVLGFAISKGMDLNDVLHKKTNDFKQQYLSGDFVPGFISKPLGLKNPLVDAGGIVPGGSQLNSDAIKWLQTQPTDPLKESFGSAMGGEVNTKFDTSKNAPRLDIAFEGLQGYKDPSSVKQGVSKTKKEIERNLKLIKSLGPNADNEDTDYLTNSIRRNEERLKGLMNQLREIKIAAEENPLASEAIRYRLGDVLSAIPENTVITAQPIGGAKGGRARLYRQMSEGALATTPVIRSRGVNLNLMPSETEFRLASEGGGMTAEAFNTAIRNYGNIRTTKTGPEEFKTWSGKTVNWNPEQLKDPLIRAAFNVGEDVDVSSLRKNPTGIFLNKRPFDTTLPVITTRSPQYITRRALVNTGKGLKTGSKGLLLDAGINYALGASPQQAFATAISDPISAESLGGSPTAAIERMGPRGEFVDTRSNTVLSPQGVYTNTGIAYKGGKPIVVPRGSIAGEGNLITQTQNILQNAGNVWRQRLSKLGMFGR
jgi:hypothetical protein